MADNLLHLVFPVYGGVGESEGQITLPKKIRGKLGVSEGDRVVLIWDEDRVVMLNPALFAMRMLQDGLKGAAEEAG
ncbi:MAG: AbrB/MazE/SpoVT family DNA-binding domain-containing protein, partial [Propionibacteriaceae bacterium]|nr:AbrB/MazE/SpoVT family DNA-binding domain-containing protein [Propionibacteriaceae bacterium]